MRKLRVIECGCASDASSEPGILRNVKILGFDSANRRRYTEEAVNSALGLYENAKVNLDHPANGPNAPRSVLERFGKLVGVHMEGTGLRGDLHYNPKHPRAAEIAWYAEHMPDMLGLSHNAVGEGRTIGGIFVIEKIHSVRSVDLVADPATTKGLYEAMDDELMTPEAGGDELMPPAEGGEDTTASYRDQLGPLVSSIVDDPNLSKAEKRKKILTALNLLDDDEPEGGGDLGDDEDVTIDLEGDDEGDEPADEPEEEDEPVEESVQIRREYVLLKRKERVRELAEQLRVPNELLSNIFVESVARLDSEPQVKAALRDRLTAAKASKPKSASSAAGRSIDLEEFARQLGN